MQMKMRSKMPAFEASIFDLTTLVLIALLFTINVLKGH